MNNIELSDKMTDVEVYAERIEALMGLIANNLFRDYSDSTLASYAIDRLEPVYDVMMCLFSDMNNNINQLSDCIEKGSEK